MGACQGASWTVNETDRIQDKIEHAGSGDTIIVNKGIYYEHLAINKSLNMLGVGMPIIDGLGNGSVIALLADEIVLDGFVAMNSSSLPGDDDGIKVISNNNIIKNNKIINCTSGLNLTNCKNNTVLNNIVSANNNGILIQESQGNEVISNNVSYNDRGIVLKDSANNTLRRNLMSGNRLNFDSEGENDIDSSNLVDGKPIYYLFRVFNRTIESPINEAGTVYCFNCNNITIRNQSLANNSYGVYFYNTTYSLIENIAFANNSNDIILQDSKLNIIYKNIMGPNQSYNQNNSIMLYKSNENIIEENRVINSKNGIIIQESGENIINGNSFNSSRSGDGIFFKKSDNNTFENNDVMGNSRYGISLDESNNNLIQNNRADYNRIGGINLKKSQGNSIMNNSFNHSIGENGLNIDKSNNNFIKSNQVSHNKQNGIRIRFSNNNTIMGNYAQENKANGIDYLRSDNNIIENNNVSKNLNGFYLYNCTKMMVSGNIALNNFANGFLIEKNELSNYKNNIAINNQKIGFLFQYCANNTVVSNKANNNTIGMVQYESRECTIFENDFSHNKANGISLEKSINNSIINNTAGSNDGIGITLLSSNYTTIKNNNLYSNIGGMALLTSSNNTILGNNYSNNEQSLYLNQSNLSQISDTEPIETNLSKYMKKVFNTNLRTYTKLIGQRSQDASTVETNRPSDISSSKSFASSRSVSENEPEEGDSLGPSLEDFSQAEKEIKKRLVRGKLVYTNITQMDINQTYLFKARIAANETDQNLTKDFSSSPSEVQGFDVSEYMEVTLAGDGFVITPQPPGSQRQQIPKWGLGKDFGQWLWNVKPIDEGMHTLILTAFAVIAVDNLPERPSLLETKTVIINVTVEKKREEQPTPMVQAAKLWDSFYAKVSALIILLISILTLNEKIKQWKKRE